MPGQVGQTERDSDKYSHQMEGKDIHPTGQPTAWLYGPDKESTYSTPRVGLSVAASEHRLHILK